MSDVARILDKIEKYVRTNLVKDIPMKFVNPIKNGERVLLIVIVSLQNDLECFYIIWSMKKLISDH